MHLGASLQFQGTKRGIFNFRNLVILGSVDRSNDSGQLLHITPVHPRTRKSPN